MFAPNGAHRIGSTPDASPDIQMDSQTTKPDPELLERESELLAIDHALSEAVDGRGSVVAVEGPPGIGKSSLVRACVERTRERET
jgi:Cdc6-like AAA superfamily ATPase